MSEVILEIRNLRVTHSKEGKKFAAVNGVSMEVCRNEFFALVGASGSGKSAVAMSVLGLHNKNFTQTNGEIIFNGQNLLSLSETELNKIRGRHISMVFQDPLSALNPLMKIGTQIEEPLTYHTNFTKQQKKSRAIELLSQVGIKSPGKTYAQLPHQLSGGMRQRVMIAMALACRPEIIIADEPTTALDATIQSQILDLLQTLQTETTIIIITHDMDIVKKYATRTATMREGKIIC
jgi:peptide/nickel transport system ATP-binding protein